MSPQQVVSRCGHRAAVDCRHSTLQPSCFCRPTVVCRRRSAAAVCHFHRMNSKAVDRSVRVDYLGEGDGDRPYTTLFDCVWISGIPRCRNGTGQACQTANRASCTVQLTPTVQSRRNRDHRNPFLCRRSPRVRVQEIVPEGTQELERIARGGRNPGTRSEAGRMMMPCWPRGLSKGIRLRCGQQRNDQRGPMGMPRCLGKITSPHPGE